MPLVLPWPPPSLEPPSQAMSQTCWRETVESLSLTRGTCVITGHECRPGCDREPISEKPSCQLANLYHGHTYHWNHLGMGKSLQLQSFLLTVFNLRGMGCRLGQRDYCRPRQSKKLPGWRPAALNQEVASTNQWVLS